MLRISTFRKPKSILSPGQPGGEQPETNVQSGMCYDECILIFHLHFALPSVWAVFFLCIHCTTIPPEGVWETKRPDPDTNQFMFGKRAKVTKPIRLCSRSQSSFSGGHRSIDDVFRVQRCAFRVYVCLLFLLEVYRSDFSSFTFDSYK